MIDKELVIVPNIEVPIQYAYLFFLANRGSLGCGLLRLGALDAMFVFANFISALLGIATFLKK